MPTETQPEPPAKVGDVQSFGGGAGSEVRVTLLRVIDPVVAPEDPPRPGNRYVGVVLGIANTGRISYEPPGYLGGTMVTTAGTEAEQALIADPSSECRGGQLQSGTISPGRQRTGCLAFEMPKDEQPETFQFAASLGSKPAEWVIH